MTANTASQRFSVRSSGMGTPVAGTQQTTLIDVTDELNRLDLKAYGYWRIVGLRTNGQVFDFFFSETPTMSRRSQGSSSVYFAQGPALRLDVRLGRTFARQGKFWVIATPNFSGGLLRLTVDIEGSNQPFTGPPGS